ncbi:MAG: SANT/Myb-like DNA-binding domain-containing protein [Hyphomonadaceae bacterium]
MAKPPALHYKSWTPSEVRTLRKLAKQKLGLEKIAKEMQRTPWSVRNRASSEGISLRTER